MIKKAQRKFIIDTIYSCHIEDFESNEQLRRLVTLLNDAEHERLITKISQLAPFDRSTAEQIIRLSIKTHWNWHLTYKLVILGYEERCTA